MIIVSQDKTMIFNFENIETIGIGNPLENIDGRFIILAETTSDNQYPIAEYKTEKRAREVLQEIIRKAEDLSWANLMDNLQIAIHDKNFGGALSNTYYIPED